jgi:hypothetical protein
MLGALAACTAGVVLSAQRGARGGASPAAGATTSARKFVAIGCVSREAPGPATTARGGSGNPGNPGNNVAAPRFLLTDTRGDKPTIYRLDGDEAELTFHVGHTVEVSGPLSAGPAGATGPNANALVMKIATLAYLSKTCAK